MFLARNIVTLRMSRTHTKALSEDPAATLDDLARPWRRWRTRNRPRGACSVARIHSQWIFCRLGHRARRCPRRRRRPLVRPSRVAPGDSKTNPCVPPSAAVGTPRSVRETKDYMYRGARAGMCRALGARSPGPRRRPPRRRAPLVGLVAVLTGTTEGPWAAGGGRLGVWTCRPFWAGSRHQALGDGLDEPHLRSTPRRRTFRDRARREADQRKAGRQHVIQARPVLEASARTGLQNETTVRTRRTSGTMMIWLAII